MARQIILNGEQFRQLVEGKVVYVAGCEISLGDVGFELFEVAEVVNGTPPATKLPFLVKPRK